MSTTLLKQSWRRLATVLGLFAAIAVPAVAGWNSGTATKDDGHVRIDCGDIVGKLGSLTGFSTSSIGGGKKTTGAVGANWNGTEPDTSSGPQMIRDNWVRHTYTKPDGQENDKLFIEIDLESTVTASGKAERHQNPPEDWHFDATATVVEHKPIVQMFESVTGTWVDMLTVYDQEKNTQAAGSGADASNNNQPAPPPLPPPPVGPPPPPPEPFSTFQPGQGNRGGDTACSAPLPYDEAELKVRAQASWTSSGGPSSAKNTKVFNEELKLSFTFKSYLE